MSVYGGMETGGSRWECAVGTGPDHLRATETIPTNVARGDDRTCDRLFECGGVMSQPELLPLIQREVSTLMNGYLDMAAVGDGIASYVTLPALSSRSGVLGAIALAETP